MRLYCFTRAFGKGHGRVEHRSGQQEHKLFSTITTDAIDLARFVFQNPRELLQYRVTDLMAVGVVHTLEAIQITQHDGDGFFQPSRMSKRLLESLLDVATIVESRERIRLRHLQQTRVHFRQLSFTFLERILQSLDAQHRFHASFELGEVDGLCDVVVSARIESFDFVLSRVECGLQDDWNERQALVRLESPYDLEPIDARHHDVEEDEIGRRFVDLRERLLAIHCGIDGVATRGEPRA